MQRRFAFNRDIVPSFSNISWLRVLVVGELVVLMLAAVAITVAPQVTLSALASAVNGARDLSFAYRPLVAFGGLVLLGLTFLALRATLSAGRVAASETGGTKPQAVQPSDDANHGAGRQAA